LPVQECIADVILAPWQLASPMQEFSETLPMEVERQASRPIQDLLLTFSILASMLQKQKMSREIENLFAAYGNQKKVE